MAASTRNLVTPRPGSPGAAALGAALVLALTAGITALQFAYPWHGTRNELLILDGAAALLTVLSTAFFRLRSRYVERESDIWIGLIFFLMAVHFSLQLAMGLAGVDPATGQAISLVSWFATQTASALVLLIFMSRQLGGQPGTIGILAGGGIAGSAGIYFLVRILQGRGWTGVPDPLGAALATLFLLATVLTLVNALAERRQRDIWLASAFLIITAAHMDIAWTHANLDPPFMWGHVLLILGLAVPLAAAVVENVQLVASHAGLVARLQQLGQRVEALLDSLPVVVLTVNPRGALTYANRRAHEMLGVPAGRSLNLAGPTWLENVHPDDADRLRRVVSDVAHGKLQRSSDEIRVERPGGTTHWLTIEAEAIHDPVAGEERVLVAGADITDLLAARRTAEERQSRLALLTNLAQTVGGETVEERILERLLELAGPMLSIDAAVLLRPSPDGSFLVPEVWTGEATSIAMVGRVAAGDHPAWSAFEDGFPRFSPPDVFGRPADGAPAVHELVHLPLLAAGHVVGVVVASRTRDSRLSTEDLDILIQLSTLLGSAVHLAKLVRELDEQRDLALEASRLKSEFLANTSHELRTPLTSILGFLKLIIGGNVPDPDRQLQFLRIAHDSGVRLLHIINDVLDLAKIEAGRLEVHPRPFTVAPLLGELESVFRHQMEGAGLEFTVVHPPAPLEVLADPDRTRQILTNLLSNSLKFTPAPGAVRLTVSGDGAEVRFTVEDTGIGIAPAEVEKVFLSFYEVDGSTTRGQGGTGLGLTISRRLAEMMGGSLGLESEGLGRGTTAHLVLPVPSGEGTAENRATGTDPS